MKKGRAFMNGLPYAILLVLDDLGKPAAAQEIGERIAVVSGRRILVETIHSAIGNMVRDGWIVDAGPGRRNGARGSRTTRLFAVSEQGFRELEACSMFLLRLFRIEWIRGIWKERGIGVE